MSKTCSTMDSKTHFLLVENWRKIQYWTNADTDSFNINMNKCRTKSRDELHIWLLHRIQSVGTNHQFSTRMWLVHSFHQDQDTKLFVEEIPSEGSCLLGVFDSGPQRWALKVFFSRWVQNQVADWAVVADAVQQAANLKHSQPTWNHFACFPLTLNPSIKHPASSLSLLGRTSDVAVWLCLSDALQSAARTNNNVYDF